ncbi:MAG: thermonuclease family protein, partial [Prosthecochloris sp.]|nr:thermonuclease family protein [Prosthecochloris sp.]
MKASRYVASAVVVLISSFATYFYTTNLDTSEWEVVTIADGDSFTLSKNNRKETFRLYGID